MTKKYDVIVIGGGPAGYVAAIRAAQLGQQVACIEGYQNPAKQATLGGTCLNVGCIPSKVLLESSEHFHRLAHLDKHGIQISGVSLDIATMQARKDGIVSQLTGGIAQLFQANKIDWHPAYAQFIDAHTLELTAADGQKSQLSASHFIIAVGSVPVDIGVAKMDDETIVDSSGALVFTAVPKRLGVIGAGVIGLEMGSVWQRLGAEVTIFEAADTFLPFMDQQIAKDAARQFKQQGLDIRLGATVQQADIQGKGKHKTVTLRYQDKKGEQQAEFDKLLVAVGRKPNTAQLFAQDIGVKLDARGFIEVDAHCQTALPHIYAIGDCVRGPMLAHKASEEGVMVAEILAGQKGHVNLDLIPSVIYTQPEIAAIGQTEEQLKQSGTPYKVGDFPFAANGRAKAMDADKGLVKILAHAETDEILGAHIVGPMASEMIHELIVAMEYRAASEDIARICHAHPSLSEAIHEAALAVDRRAIHKVNKA